MGPTETPPCASGRPASAEMTEREPASSDAAATESPQSASGSTRATHTKPIGWSGSVRESSNAALSLLLAGAIVGPIVGGGRVPHRGAGWLSPEIPSKRKPAALHHARARGRAVAPSHGPSPTRFTASAHSSAGKTRCPRGRCLAGGRRKGSGSGQPGGFLSLHARRSRYAALSADLD